MRPLTCLRPAVACCVLMTPALGALGQTGADGQAVLNQALQFAKSVRTIQGDMTTTLTTAKGSQLLRSQVWAEMPEKIVTRTDSPGNSVFIYCVGKQQFTYFSKSNKYSQTELPAPNAQAVLQDFLSMGLGSSGPLADKGGRQVTLVGKETLAGVSTNHLRVTVPGGANADLWIADGAQPLPVYMRLSEPRPPATSETFCRWSVNQPIPASTFHYAPPPGSTDMLAGVKKRN